MNIRQDKSREYFVRLLDVPEDEIDFSDIPPTVRADWEDAEVLLPVTAEEFQAVKRFIRDRRERAIGAAADSHSE